MSPQDKKKKCARITLCATKGGWYNLPAALKTVLFHLSLSISVFIYSFTLCPADAAFFFISSFLPLGTVKFILSYFFFYILVLVRYLVKFSAFSFHRFLPLEILLSSCYDNKNTWGAGGRNCFGFLPLVLSLCIFALLIK